MGTIKLFAGTFGPVGYMLCQGQTLPIAQNAALFSIIGTTYGGNGQTTFALPDLRGRAPIGADQGPGLSNYVLGQTGGAETMTISQSNMPAHTHITKVSNAEASVAVPVAGNSLAAMIDTSANQILSYSTGAPTINLNTNTNSIAGASTPMPILQPYLALNYIICTQGVFPSRN